MDYGGQSEILFALYFLAVNLLGGLISNVCHSEPHRSLQSPRLPIFFRRWPTSIQRDTLKLPSRCRSIRKRRDGNTAKRMISGSLGVRGTRIGGIRVWI